MYADKGFVVARVNYRGGSGRGIAFAKAIFGDWGHKEVEDLLGGVDHLVALGIGELVMVAMVRCPPQGPALHAGSTYQRKRELHRPRGTESAVREIAVIERRDSEHAHDV